jgi:hypothetical protein
MTDYEPTSNEVLHQTIKSPIVWASVAFIIFILYIIFTSSGGIGWIIGIFAIGCFGIAIYFSHQSSRSRLKVKYYDKEIERLHEEIIEDLNMKR